MNTGLVYLGGHITTFQIDADQLCGFWLKELVDKCGNYENVECIYYLIPHLSLEKGLRKVYTDEEVRIMAEIVSQFSTIDIYVFHGGDPPESLTLPTTTDTHQLGPHTVRSNRPPKMTPKRAPRNKLSNKNQLHETYSLQNCETQPPNRTPATTTDIGVIPQALSQQTYSFQQPNTAAVINSVPEDYDWIDPRPNSPVPLKDLLEGWFCSDDESDPEFHPEGSNDEVEGLGYAGADDEYEEEWENEEEQQVDLEEPVATDVDTSDDECKVAREKVRGCKTKLLELSKRLQQEALEGRNDLQKLGQPSKVFAKKYNDNIESFSDYEYSDQDIHTPPESGDEDTVEDRRTKRSLIVGKDTCLRNMEKNRQMKASWLADQFLEIFKARPHWPAKEICETIRLGFKAIVKRDFAYRVKYLAHRKLHGSMKEHYLKVGKYIQALKNSSPGSVIELVHTAENGTKVFQRLFVCFEGLQKGWKQGCRKIICIDACFLKTFLGGQLMSAVGRDGNDQMYPIAWAVVEGENNESWGWFLTHLQRSLELGQGANLVIVSDENQAILTNVASVLPDAEHRHCARHIFALWHRSFRGDDMKLKFWTIAKSYNSADYDDALAELDKEFPAAAIAFKGYNPKVFCRSHMKTISKADVITSNMVETFNNYIINARTKHLIYMLEDIRASLMQRLVVKRQEANKWTSNVCPRIQLKLEKEKDEAAKCDVIPSTNILFQVNHYLDSLTVNLEQQTCTCKKWDSTGIPCCHAVAAIFFCHKKPEDFVSGWYKKEVYLKAYANAIEPLDGERHWPSSNVQVDPPPVKIGPGRPRKNRRKDPFENPKKPSKLTKHGMEMTCSICNAKGHNKRRCPDKNTAQVQEPQPKRPKGRPRADGKPAQPRPTVPPSNHHTTAEPSRLGRGGRVVLAGRGRGKGTGGREAGGRGNGGRGRGVSVGARGRGGRGRGRGSTQVPQGQGVLVANDGTTYTNVPASNGPRMVTNDQG